MAEVLPLGNAHIATAAERSLSLQAEELAGVCYGRVTESEEPLTDEAFVTAVQLPSGARFVVVWRR